MVTWVKSRKLFCHFQRECKHHLVSLFSSFRTKSAKITCFRAHCCILAVGFIAVSILYDVSNILRETRPEIATISILCFGDSLTAGSMDTSYTHHPYSTKLQEYLNVRDRRMLDETVKPVFKVFPAGLPSERAKPRLKQLLQDLKITYYRVIILGGTNDLKKYEENSSFDFYDVLSIFNALVKLHNVSHTFGARSVAVSIPEVECEISETCPNFKARNKINEPLQSFVARNKRYMVLTDFANEIMYRSRDQNLWSGPVHFLPAVFTEVKIRTKISRY